MAQPQKPQIASQKQPGRKPGPDPETMKKTREHQPPEDELQAMSEEEELEAGEMDEEDELEDEDEDALDDEDR